MAANAKNPFTWVEIYVEDMSRAQKFYETILEIKMSELPMPEGMGEMQPGTGGTLVYFACDDCAVEEGRVENAGGKVLQPKMSIGDYGFCSVVMDTEGNSIGLHSNK